MRMIAPATLGLVLLVACSTPRIDWARVEAEGRLVDEPPALTRFMDDHRFSSGEAALRLERGGSPFRAADRLTVTARGARGIDTPFIVDTASVFTMLSASAPLAAEAALSKKHRFGTSYGTPTSGWMGQLPVLHLDSMRMSDVLVGIRESAHSHGQPANVLGLRHIWNTQLAHENGRWTLRTLDRALPWDEAGWNHVELLPGIPVVKIEAPSGEVLNALIDTGSPYDMALPIAAFGTYRLRDRAGRIVLEVPIGRRAPWPEVKVEGRDIHVVLGLASLKTREFRLTFRRSAWILAPER